MADNSEVPSVLQPNSNESKEPFIYNQLLGIWRDMIKAKPIERSEKSRRYAVAITETEKVISYFKVFVMDEEE